MEKLLTTFVIEYCLWTKSLKKQTDSFRNILGGANFIDGFF